MQIYITDKTGQKRWNTEVTAEWAQGERANFRKRLDAIKSGHPAYSHIDRDSARIVEELSAYDLTDDRLDNMSDDELLAELDL